MQLDELFLLVVVGEFNAGKSALVNTILGEKVLPEGATDHHTGDLVKWVKKITGDRRGFLSSLSAAAARELNIVDTPGTNAIIRHHERLTEELVPRSGLVLFTIR